MRAVFVLFDSLNRHDLGCYGGKIPTPNFDRFAKRALTFDNHFVGSLPCMPARRDLHTGRMNFMHRSWGPLEPFDNSLPQLLQQDGVYTHLLSDHFHYLEDGGATYHNRYSTWEIIRGQEYDCWGALAKPPVDRFARDYSDKHYNDPAHKNRRQHQINRSFIREEADFPGPQCFSRAIEFLDNNIGADDWLLQLECFDPHEPFVAPSRFRERFPTGYDGPILDWPHYGRADHSDDEIAEIRANYAALMTMCDEYFGHLLDYFDRHDLWKDTALILSTDHGFLLSEHDLWGKNMTPWYDELARIPLIMHVPGRTEGMAGQHTPLVTQTPDLMPTLLEIFDKPIPAEVRAPSILPRLDQPDDGRAVIFGMFGGPIGVADATHRLIWYPPDLDDESLNEYTLMPTHLHSLFTPEELRDMRLHGPLDFTKGIPLMQIPARVGAKRPPGPNREVFKSFETMLFDITRDPAQIVPINDAAVLDRMVGVIRQELQRHDATPEFFRWIGIAASSTAEAKSA